MKGTTFSGHPTLTTLGNTLRSIMYVKYVSQSMGVKIPSLAAGDDVVAWVKKSDLD